MKLLLDPGDCFSIPLRDQTFAFGQYVVFHAKAGPLVRIFDLRAPTPNIPVDELRRATLLFPPIFVGLNPPVKIGRWKKIGAFPIEGFEFPKFRASLLLKDGTNNDWKIWDGQVYLSIGILSPEYEHLELKAVYPYQDVEERILTGRHWVLEKR